MSSRSDFVSIEIAGQRIDTWTEYRVESDILTPADAFTLTVELGSGRGQVAKDDFTRIRELLTTNASVELFVGADIHGGARRRAMQLTGFIDDVTITVTKAGGAVIVVQGRDLAGHLCDSAVPVNLIRSLGDNATLEDVIRAAVAPWNIPVISDATAARNILTGASGLTSEQRLRVEQARVQGINPAFMTQHIMREAQAAKVPVDTFTGTTASDRARRHSSNGMVGSDIERIRIGEASPHAGETVWSFCQRHCERNHVMMWMSPRGELIVGTPDYTNVLYRFVRRFTNNAQDPNNMSDCVVHRSGAGRYSKVTVYGRAHGQDITRSPIRAVAEDTSMPFRRAKIEHLSDCRTQDHANAAAKRILHEGAASAEVLTLTADDHGQGRYLYAVNTMADILDEYSGIQDQRYVAGRTFERSNTGGTRTILRLLPENSLTL